MLTLCRVSSTVRKVQIYNNLSHVSHSLSTNSIDIKGLFKRKDNIREVTALLHNHRNHLTFTEIADVLFWSSKKHQRLTSPQLQNLIHAVRQRNGILNATNVSKFFYGFRQYGVHDKYILKLLGEVHPLLTSSSDVLKTVDGHAIGVMIYGFQRQSSRDIEVRNIINFFTKVIEECNEKLSIGDISRLFYGLQNFDSDDAEVKSVCLVSTCH